LAGASACGDLGDGSRGYDVTVCAVPVRILAGAQDEVRIVRRDGTVRSRAGRSLTREESVEVFNRTGTILGLEVSTTMPASDDRSLAR
jgi:hypothetical protein